MSVFLILNIVLTQGIQTVQDKIDVSVYFNDKVKEAEIGRLQKTLSENPDVKSIKYVSKEEAAKKFEDSFKGNADLKESLVENEVNPLPASLEIKTYQPEKLQLVMPIFDQPENKSIIRKVSYKENKEVIDRLFKATEFIRKVGWGLAGLFIFTSLIVIFNTIRIAIFTHREEIDIMKLVGANPWFIKWPFLIEGMMHGIFGTVLSLVTIYVLLRAVAMSLNDYFGGLGTGDQVLNFLMENLTTLIVLQVGVGIIIGMASSYMAVRRHLKRA